MPFKPYIRLSQHDEKQELKGQNMKFFKKQLFLDFEQPTWELNPVLFIMHQILDCRPDIILLAKACFPKAKDESKSVIGRDGMTLEQIIRCAIFKQCNRMNYEQLSLATNDSKLGRAFMKMENKPRFSAQALQENISKISTEVLDQIHQAIALYAIELGVDDGKKVRPDSTVIKANIHYPTNAALLGDCVRVACRLLRQSKDLLAIVRFRCYAKASKKTVFKIVNTKGNNAKQKRIPLFRKLLRHTKCCENQVIEAIAILGSCALDDKVREKQRKKLLQKLQDLLPRMQQIQNVTYRREILNEQVPVADKLFSIFEDHADCISKGSREAEFGHKVNLTVGDSHFVFDCILERGNPADTGYYPKTIDNLKNNLGIVPESIASDGGYASKANRDYALSKNIKNVVFNKVKGALQNVASSKKMETLLKKWRSGVEAMISNFKRGLNAGICTWKGWEAFEKFVMWNVITFNLRIIARSVLQQLA